MREGFVGIDVELLAHFSYAVQHGVAVRGEGLTRCFERMAAGEIAIESLAV